MSRIASAIVTMILSRQLVLVFAGIGLVVLARLLTPADFGVFATVLAVFLLLEIVIRCGLPEYLISVSRLSAGMLRAALGVSLTAAGVVIALALAFLLTPLSDWLSAELRLGLLAMVPGLALLPLAMVPEAMLRRRLKFGLLAWLGVGTAAVDVAVSIALALLGAGALALVGGLVASRLVTAGILLVTSRRLLRARWTGSRRFLAFAPRMTATTLLPKFADLGVVLIIPSALGLAALGLFNRAQTVVALLDRVLLDGVSPVVLPAISERLRAGAPAAEVYGAKTARLAALTWPVFAVIALIAEPLVLVLLGEQWTGAIDVVRILCVAGLVVPFTSMNMQFFAATGRIDYYLRIQMVNQIVRVAFVALGALHSLEAVAWGLTIARMFKALHVRRNLAPMIDTAGRRARLVNYLRSAAVSLAALAGPAMLLVARPGSSPLILCVGSLALAALGWLIGVVLTRHPLLDDFRALPILRRPALRPLRRMLS